MLILDLSLQKESSFLLSLPELAEGIHLKQSGRNKGRGIENWKSLENLLFSKNHKFFRC